MLTTRLAPSYRWPHMERWPREAFGERLLRWIEHAIEVNFRGFHRLQWLPLPRERAGGEQTGKMAGLCGIQRQNSSHDL